MSLHVQTCTHLSSRNGTNYHLLFQLKSIDRFFYYLIRISYHDSQFGCRL
ncbi:hypothetical protein CI610_03287 [invertebrate metagenome]|uniref:Uncharacterized protein n=1 Tax=invertebrate metagenome TaxID=1711999 RepID=A0A2H9T3I0_9ZZZZ